jgi:hypothetical protein
LDHARLRRQQTLALQLFAGEFAGATDGFRLLPDSPFRRFLVILAQLHLAKETFALHLLFQRPEGLVDIVVTDENLHVVFSSLIRRLIRPTVKAAWPLAHGYAQPLLSIPTEARMSLYSIRSFRGNEKAESINKRRTDQIAFANPL